MMVHRLHEPTAKKTRSISRLWSRLKNSRLANLLAAAMILSIVIALTAYILPNVLSRDTVNYETGRIYSRGTSGDIVVTDRFLHGVELGIRHVSGFSTFTDGDGVVRDGNIIDIQTRPVVRTTSRGDGSIFTVRLTGLTPGLYKIRTIPIESCRYTATDLLQGASLTTNSEEQLPECKMLPRYKSTVWVMVW